MKRYLSVAALFALLTGLYLLPSLSADAQNGGDWGTIKGVVTYDPTKPIPERTKLNVTKDQGHCLADGPILSEDWVVNAKNRGVRDVFIWLEPAEKGGTLPVHPSLASSKNKQVVVDQPRCAFVPHAMTLRTDQILVAKNSAPIAHNFRWSGHPLLNPGGNRLMPPASEFKVELKKDRLPITLKCDIHPWMTGYIRVFDHPYHAVTDSNGSFVIPNAPAGNYILKVWHPAIGWLGGAQGKDGQPIQIKAGGDTPVNLNIGQP
jgi:hypothetical protein